MEWNPIAAGPRQEKPRCWGMSSAQLPMAPASAPGTDPVCRLGAWFFVPDRVNACGDVRTGYLHGNGERVVLEHCSRLLADFARTIRLLEDDFSVRCTTEQTPAAG
ncbi:hypothetical protein GCM10025734_46090 [Kitasatospora paranensis]